MIIVTILFSFLIIAAAMLSLFAGLSRRRMPAEGQPNNRTCQDGRKPCGLCHGRTKRFPE
jgi:hypothetical protein